MCVFCAKVRMGISQSLCDINVPDGINNTLLCVYFVVISVRGH